METRSVNPAAPARRVPRMGRVLDLVGLALFACGGGLGLWAWRGFRQVPAFQPGMDEGPWAAVRLANEYWRLQKIGVGLMLAGVTVFVLAWWVARRRQAG